MWIGQRRGCAPSPLLSMHPPPIAAAGRASPPPPIVVACRSSRTPSVSYNTYTIPTMDLPHFRRIPFASGFPCSQPQCTSTTAGLGLIDRLCPACSGMLALLTKAHSKPCQSRIRVALHHLRRPWTIKALSLACAACRSRLMDGR
ncbi:hypothetical protein LZ30DRAFT_164714 [Colletotrichum cereale]|nr:hypothetical protein LZ30DRAFT_164714 [Colletotrichum cereale]